MEKETGIYPDYGVWYSQTGNTPFTCELGEIKSQNPGC
jgi:hypothetical protein